MHNDVLLYAEDEDEHSRLTRIVATYGDELPQNYIGRSVAPSDVIELYDDKERKYFYRDENGFFQVKFSPMLAKPMINILFEHGQFGSKDTLMTSFALMAYSVGLPCYVLVKALMPNFFARGDTITPVKFSAVVFITHLIFSLILMRPFGHVGIAIATTISAFVSLAQYVYGLKKRQFWSFSTLLMIKIGKILISSILMGGVVLGIYYVLNIYFVDWLKLNIIIKLFILGATGVFGLATFLFLVTIMKVFDVSQILQLLKKKRGNNAKQTIMDNDKK